MLRQRVMVGATHQSLVKLPCVGVVEYVSGISEHQISSVLCFGCLIGNGWSHR